MLEISHQLSPSTATRYQLRYLLLWRSGRFLKFEGVGLSWQKKMVSRWLLFQKQKGRFLFVFVFFLHLLFCFLFGLAFLAEIVWLKKKTDAFLEVQIEFRMCYDSNSDLTPFGPFHGKKMRRPRRKLQQRRKGWNSWTEVPKKKTDDFENDFFCFKNLNLSFIFNMFHIYILVGEKQLY